MTSRPSVRFEARPTSAAAGQEVPIPIGLAQVRRRLFDDCVIHADASLLNDRGQFRSGRRVAEDGKIERRRRTDDVVDSDGQKGRTGSLVVEGQVDTAFRYGHASGLRVDVGLSPGVTNNVIVRHE